ncbi:MAG TPA: TIGR00730 family Rossman fold protein [Candidatus Limnocylindria bacterium]|nr:TIGR00730 family Rossman fold protein [Candidatus Limnocylindria bacterium]
MRRTHEPARPRAVCVFCASSTVIDPAHIDTAAEVGAEIARRGWTLVSGGGTVGSMGAVARAARAEGGHTVGVIPRALVALEVADHDADELVVTDDMRSRKGVMDERCDAFLGLPGGLGTLEELLEVWVARSLGMHAKPIVVLDPEGTYAGLNALIDSLVERRFVRPEARDAVAWATTVPEAFALLEQGWLSTAVPPEPTPEEVLEAEL